MMKLSPVWQNYAYLKNQKTVQQVIVQNALEEDFDTSTKGHSVLRRANYSPRRAAGDTYLPEYVPRKLGYESSTEEHSISGAVTNATLATDAFLYDNFDTANRSRGRDQKLLADATAALVSSEAPPPRASVTSKRVARKTTYPPGATNYPGATYPPVRTEVVRPTTRRGPVSPIIIFLQPAVAASAAARQRVIRPYVPLGRAPPAIPVRVPRPRSSSSERVRRPYVARRRAVVPRALTIGEYLLPLILAQAPLRYRLRSVTPGYGYVSCRKPRRAKAAIVASKVEVEPRKKRPRSKFAADKLRTSRAPVEEAVQRSAPTSGLHASRPPLRISQSRYRMEARTDPVDIIYRPGSFNRMRDQVRNAHDKLDRHRQLLDRYLVEGGSASDVRRRTEDPSFRSSVSYMDSGSLYENPPSVVSQQSRPSKQPVSELRRRLRRTVCRSRGEPNYYRDRE